MRRAHRWRKCRKSSCCGVESGLALSARFAQASETALDRDHRTAPAVSVRLARQYGRRDRSSLLERRPDIRQAEQNLIASNADIGVAKAAYFPQVSLTALFGVESAQVSDLFKGASKSWSLGSAGTLPIFTAGRVRNQVEQAKAAQREALYFYQKSIINAFEDFEDALVDRAKFEQVREEQTKNVAALQRFRELAVLRYQEGVTIYLEVANAEQSLFNAQLQLVNTQSQLFQSYVNLYRAMGGGWLDAADRLGGRRASPMQSD